MPSNLPRIAPVPGAAEPVTDLDLAEGIRQGSVAAFEELYQRYWSRLYAFAFRYLHSADEAQDVVQEVYFRIWRGRAEWRVAGRLDSYLFLAVRNGAFDRLKHAAVVDAFRKGAEAETSERAATNTGQEALEAGEIDALLERSLGEMPEKRRAVCMLRWVHGLSYSEIAARLGIAEKTVETQVSRGLKHMRDRVTELRG